MPILVFLAIIAGLFIVVALMAAWGLLERDKYTKLYPITISALSLAGWLIEKKFPKWSNLLEVQVACFFIGALSIIVLAKGINKLRDK